MILSGVINMKPLLILSLLFILTGCGDSEVAEENNNEIYQQRAYARYDEAIGISTYYLDSQKLLF